MCARKLDGTTMCWGFNDGGQAGGGVAGSPDPTPNLIAGSYLDVTGGGHHTCVLDTAGAISCVGANSNGQLGRGTTSIFEATFVPMTGVPSFATVAAGARHTCATEQDGSVWCWGCNNYAPGTDCSAASNTLTPTKIVGAQRLHGARRGSCFGSASGIACWGQNEDGQLGDGSITPRTSIAPVSVVTAPIDVVIGRRYGCGLRDDGTVWCWGGNDEGQLGRGAMTIRELDAQPVAGVTGIVELAAGRAHTCALTGAGEMFCWGAGGVGQLGNNTMVDHPVAVTVPLTDVAHMGTGRGSTCAARSDGLYCWGDNTQGAVGDGTSNNFRPSPTLVLPCP